MRLIYKGVLGAALAAGAVGSTGCEDHGSKMTVHIDVVGRSPVIAAQIGDEPWQPLVPDADGHAQLTVPGGRFGLATMCDQPRAFTRIDFSGELTDRTVTCGVVDDSAVLRGTTAPDAEVFVEQLSVTADAAGMYDTATGKGTHDVFALLRGAPSKLYAMRGVTVAGDTVLDLPVATAGTDMLAVTPTVTGARGPVMVFSDLTAAHGDYVYFGDDPATVVTLPPAMRADGDHPAIGAVSDGCTAQRPAAPSIALAIPGAFTADVTRAQVTWTADPAIAWDFTSVFMRLAGRASIQYFADAAWLGGATTLPLVELATLPGFRSSFPSIPTGEPVLWTVTVERGDRAAALDSCASRGSATF